MEFGGLATQVKLAISSLSDFDITIWSSDKQPFSPICQLHYNSASLNKKGNYAPPRT